MDWVPRILVIDDNLAIHDDFRKILSLSSEQNNSSIQRLNDIKNSLFQEESDANLKLPRYELDFASQGEDALALVKNKTDNPYTIAFVDIRMPPGWDVLKRFRKFGRLILISRWLYVPPILIILGMKP